MNISIALAAVLVLVGVALGINNFVGKAECEKKGGEWARPMFSVFFKCYKGTL